MHDIGLAVNMNYGCNTSLANTENEAASSFKNDFAYSSATFANFYAGTVKQNITANQLVILRGSINTDGHAWVCDGYRTHTNWSDDCSTSWDYLYLHMNWGWEGSFNGWYNHTNWTIPGEGITFNNNKKMVYNIKPN
jgi:hypothetical protein